MTIGKPWEVVVVWNIVTGERKVHDKVKRRLPELADIRSCIALREVKQSVAAADHGLTICLVSEADPRGAMRCSRC